MTDYCRYVNVFQGCEEVDLPEPEGIAAHWFFLKAGCGNTSPAACLPFSAVSAGPFSGGYPTGYTDHMPNSHSRPPRFPGGKGLSGFAHLQQSGTGAMGYYYNYAVVTPRYADSPERREPSEESARPGYYSAVLEDIRCELTVSGRTAVHRYTFGSPGGEVTVDFTNNGLDIPGVDRAPVNDLHIRSVDEYTVAADALIEGVRMYFAVRCNAPAAVTDKGLVTRVPDDGRAVLLVSLSPKNAELPLERVRRDTAFDKSAAEAYERWNAVLSKIRIDTPDEIIREIFYSNLYHSLVKPADWSGESFLYDRGAFTVDLNTLWDMYKTELPMLFAVYGKEIGEKVCETLFLLCETLGSMPNSIGLSDEYAKPNGQARMLGFYALLTAYRYGLDVDPARLLADLKTDLYSPANADFVSGNKCASASFFLDITEMCSLAAALAEELGDSDTAETLAAYGRRWREVYDEETGLLKDEGSFYEGSLYNYSFRQMADMDARIALAGGAERFAALLDRFFGYGSPRTVRPTDPRDYAPVAAGVRLGRFEGFNNESDTEAPWSYIYAGRQDRTAEIVRGGLEYMFTTGRGGIPGNNDTGALSSYYVLAALGLFPVAGQDLFLIGSPVVKSASVELSNGNILQIRAPGTDKDRIYVREARFNGRPLPDFRLPASELMGGGTLEFDML